MTNENYEFKRFEEINMERIPERYKDLEYELVPKHFKEAVAQIKNVDGKGLFIYGGVGTGKTYSLYSLTKRFGLRVENYTKLLDRIYGNLENKRYILEAVTAYMLGLDDVGTEKHTEYNQDILYGIINDMNINKRRLFISTNLTPEEFEEKYGDRIFSRICQMCDFVEFTGEDKRI